MSILELTDEELCMLEQLTYLDKKVTEAAKIQSNMFRITQENVGQSISGILRFFNEDALANLRLAGIFEGEDGYKINYAEWADTIAYLQKSRLSKLVLTDIMFNNDYHKVYVKFEDQYYSFEDYLDKCKDKNDKTEQKQVGLFLDEETIKTIINDDEDNDGRLGNIDKFINGGYTDENGDVIRLDKGEEIIRLPLALCFAEEEPKENEERQMLEKNEAIIAYKGTSGANEWADNAIGAYAVETLPQKEAVEFAKRMVKEHNYTELTVTGHSKGANKAMYTTIMCHNVKRCVAFDGQGFSRAFLSDRDNIDRIIKRAGLIKNYSLSTDFVHILLNQIPGSWQYICKGYGLSGFESNHSPNSFFVQDPGTGELDLIKLEGSGIDDELPHFEFDIENERVAILQDLIQTIVRNSNESMMNYIGKLLRAFRGDDNKKEALFGDIPHFSELLGDIIFYMNEHDMDFDEIKSILLEFDSNMSIGKIDDILNVLTIILDAHIILTPTTPSYLVFAPITITVADFLAGKATDYLLESIDENDKPDVFNSKVVWIFDKKKNNVIKFGIISTGVALANPSIIMGAFALDKILDNASDKVNEYEELYDEIWSELINAYGKLKNPHYDWGDIYKSEFFSSNPEYRAKYENDIVSVIIASFADNTQLLEEVGLDSLEELEHDLLMYPRTTLEKISKNEEISKTLDFLFKEYLDDIAEELGYSWQIETVNNNVILQDKANTILYTGHGDDYVRLSNKNNIVLGGSGNDVVFAGRGDDKIYGDSGNDTIYGGEGNDIISAGAGNDHVWGEDGEDNISATSGKNHLFGGKHNDTITGGSDTDWIYGEDEDDTIMGGSGNDMLFGGNNDDTLDGGSGTDYLYGGNHKDTYIIAKNRQQNYIFDPYGSNVLDFADIRLDEIELDISAENENALDIRVKNDNSVFTILKISDTYRNFSLRFKDETNPNEFVYYDFVDKNGVIEIKARESDWGTGSTDSDTDDIWSRTRDRSKDKNADDYKEAEKKRPPRDPLVIDLNHDGVNTTDVENGVYFDIDNNGFAEKTAWIDEHDGFLVYNRDDNAKITNGTELFSDQVIFPDGTKSADGFEVLKTFDTNGDKVVNKDDAEFDKLRVWIDKDHNGETWLPENGQPDNPIYKELFTLTELGITAISTEFQVRLINANDEFNKEYYASVKTAGNDTTISEHWFEANSYDTQELNTEGDGVSLTSFGIMPSLTNALAADESGELALLVEDFKNAEGFVEKRFITKKILYFITNANEISPNSRGGSVYARDLHVIETIMGVDHFIGANGSATPNSNAAPLLKELYVKFENLYLSLLDNELDDTGYIGCLEERINEDGNVVIDLEYIDMSIENASKQGKNVEKMIFSIGSYLKTYDNAWGTNCFEAFKEVHSEYASTLETIINADSVLGTNNDDTIKGTKSSEVIWGDSGNDTISAGSGDDVVYGNDGDDIIKGDAGNDILYGGDGNDHITGGAGSDTIFGEEGNDILSGGSDNDVLYGGNGNDSLNGGTGDDILNGGADDDTYIINTEHGNDIIYDSEGMSTIVFEDEISAESYSLNIDINSGISLTNTETGESIAIPDFINMPESYNFVFAGESKIIGGGDSYHVIEGTDEDDTITAGEGFNIIRGCEGNDTITGGDNLNFIYGGNGNDVINGGNGTNIIRGENGDDTITDGSSAGYLDGGNGNDIIYAGAGNDVIIGGAGADMLYGEDGDDVIAGNEDNDEIFGGSGNDTIYADAGNDTVHGDDGNDSLFGGNDDDTLYGDAGDDYLEAGNGEDNLYGGAGNDVFVGGEGVNNMYGEDGDDIFYGGNGINNMYGGEGDDNFTGGELADYIEGGAGNDTMNGGNGNNRMFGNDGDDMIYGGNDDDYIEGGNGNDSLFGGNGVNTIYGNDGNDVIYGGNDGSFLYGGDGDDHIYAGSGADVLDGGSGNDYLQGDHGNDTYIFGRGYDVDTIAASSDLHTVIIHDYLVSDMYNTREMNNDLVINFGTDTGDSLIVKAFFNYNSNRDFNFIFDDGTVLGQYDITAKSAPITGTDDNDYLFGTDGNDIFDGGAGDDSLNGSNGEDTYIFGKGYAHDTINEWGSDHSIVELKDIASDEITVSDQWGSNLLIAVNDTEDVLTISNFKWGQASYTFNFADGAEGYVDKDTWQLILTKQPDPVEEDIEQTNAELLNEIYSDDELGADIFENDSTIISEVTDSITVSEDTDEVSDMTDIQTMILAENMSAFSDDSNVYDSTNITDITADTSVLDHLLVSSSVQ